MAGTDYSGLAICPDKVLWTNIGYIKEDKKVILDFHKFIEEPITVNRIAGTDNLNLYLYRAPKSKNEWFVLAGYIGNFEHAIDAMRNLLSTLSKKQREKLRQLYKMLDKIEQGKLDKHRVV